MAATGIAPKGNFSIPGPMFIPNSRGTYCGICGMWITQEDEDTDVESNHAQPLQDTEDDSEEGGSSRRRFGELPNPGWTCFYRVIIKNSKKESRKQPQYHLSGIGRYHLWDHESEARLMYEEHCDEPVFTVPWDREAAIVNVPRLTTEKTDKEGKSSARKMICVYPATFFDDLYQDMYPHGFPIHAHCWALAERIIGGSAEKELKLLVRILQQRWEDESLLEGSQSMTDWLMERTWGSNRFESEFEMTRNLIAVRDPLAVQEVFDLIQRSGLVYADGVERDAFKRATMEPTTTTRMKAKKNSALALSLPAEILSLVLDHLHYMDIRRALEATEWQIPDSYWRCRLRQWLIFELDDVGPDAYLDWQFLCLEAEQLMEESFGLMNRQRICNALEEVKQKLDFFLSAVETSPDLNSAETPSSDEEDEEEEQGSEWEQPEFWDQEQGPGQGHDGEEWDD